MAPVKRTCRCSTPSRGWVARRAANASLNCFVITPRHGSSSCRRSSLPPQRDVLRQQVSGATRERMLREMAEAVEAMTAEGPVILVLEDLHWSDYSTLDLIAYRGAASRPRPAHGDRDLPAG